MHSKRAAPATKVITAAACIGGAWLALRFLLPWTAPMLLAFASALILEPGVKAMSGRIPRSAAAGILVLAFLAVFGFGAWLILSRAFRELGHLGERLPEIISAISTGIGRLETALGGFIRRLPPELRGALNSAGTGLRDYLSALPAKLSAKAVEVFTGFVSDLPTWLLFAVTWVMGLYFISAAYPSLVAFLKRQIPPRIFIKLQSVKRSLQQSFGKFIKAQLIMSAISFGVMLLLFLLLRVGYALVPALLIALIDALPVFGAGTVLLPWAAWELLGGDPNRGLGLAIGYAGLTILRSCIQAKLLGDQLGLHPAVTLLAIYAGWKAMGIWGMLLFPMAAIGLKRLNESGLIKLWKGADTNDRSNLQHNSGGSHEYSGGNEYPSR